MKKIENNTRKFKILVVDDNPNNIQVIGNILRASGYIISFAVNGLQALEILENTIGFDLVLLDIDMPIMNGFDACIAIRKDKKLKEIPVIFLTAHNDFDKIVEGFDLGAQDYVTKPFNSKELLARVNTHLQLKYKSDQIKEMNRILEDKNKKINDSIDYANYVQQYMLPPITRLSDVFPESFIFNKPKDIVSGDFYWFKLINNKFYVVVGDCTGHGVAGAMVSMLGISMLNQIMSTQINDANLILNELRSQIKQSLDQHKNIEHHFGIDISLCVIDFDDNTMQFSGAYNSIFLVQKNSADNGFELIEIKADHMPIGTHPKDQDSFTNQEIDLSNIYSIYLSSDGFKSQIGGDEVRSFNSIGFKNLLMKISDKPMVKQKKILEQTLQEWQLNEPQTDDLLVIGIQIKERD